MSLLWTNSPGALALSKFAGQRQTYYHASPHDFEQGEHVETGHPTNFGEPEEHNYFSTTPERAQYWGKSIEEEGHGPSTIYKVHTTGPHEVDPYAENYDSPEPTDFRSRHPLEVAGEA